MSACEVPTLLLKRRRCMQALHSLTSGLHPVVCTTVIMAYLYNLGNIPPPQISIVLPTLALKDMHGTVTCAFIDSMHQHSHVIQLASCLLTVQHSKVQAIQCKVDAATNRPGVGMQSDVEQLLKGN